MSYMDIENLYKNQDVLMFRECFALEKIDGTSSHITLKDGSLRFFAGGASHEEFIRWFDSTALLARFTEIGHPDITVFGEAYGGKCQGMKHVYGLALRFIAFEVRVGDSWLAVPQAADVTARLGLEFVAYDRIPATLEAIDAHKALPSVQAQRNECGVHEREGDVLRPPIEVKKNNGARIIAKHKNDSFSETTRVRPVVDPQKMEILEAAQAIADDWVTPMRLAHVLDALRAAGTPCTDMSSTGVVIRAMTDDVRKESEGEVVWTPDAVKAIGKATARVFKDLVRRIPTC